MKIRSIAHLLKFGLFAKLPSEVGDALRNIIRSVLVYSVISRIRKLERHCGTLGNYFDLIQNFQGPVLPIDLSSGQRKKEILNLLGKTSALGVKNVAEIGTCRGGTFYLLCKASREDASILTMDITMPWWRKKLVSSFVRVKQTAIIIKGDSHQLNTISHVKKSLEGGLDLLFVDGDHSYIGVKKDFTGYSPLVRKGGWIAFHDIVPANPASKGIHGGGWTGGVPKFWSEVKQSSEHFEIIENPSQDGAGIGVLVQKQTAIDD